MVSPIIIASAVEVGALASLGITQKVWEKILKNKVKVKRKKRGRNQERRVLGEVNDVFYMSESAIAKGDSYLNPFLKKGKKNQFGKSYNFLEKTQKKYTHHDFPDSSAMRRIARVEKKLGSKKGLLDRPLKDYSRLLS